MKQSRMRICSLSSRRTIWSRQMHTQGALQQTSLFRRVGMSEV